MGYTTDFEGTFALDRPLSPEHAAYLRAFSHTRRMARSALAEDMTDDVRSAAGLPIGEESGYFVGGGGNFGQARDASIVSYNDPPKGQPGLWCQWVPTEDNTGIEWNGSEKFYSYVEWLRYLVDNFIKPWGYVLSGRVTWRGEDHGDVGAIVVADNIVEAIDGIATRTCPKCGTSVEAD